MQVFVLSPVSVPNLFARPVNFLCCEINKFLAAFISAAFNGEPGLNFNKLPVNVSAFSPK